MTIYTDNGFPKNDDEDLQTALPAGQYTAQVVDAKITTHKKGHDVVQFLLDIDNGEGGGALLPKYSNLTSKLSVETLKMEMQNLGFKVHSRNDLKPMLEKLKGRHVTVAVSYNDQGYPVLFLLRPAKQNESEMPNNFDKDAIWN